MISRWSFSVWFLTAKPDIWVGRGASAILLLFFVIFFSVGLSFLPKLFAQTFQLFFQPLACSNMAVIQRKTTDKPIFGKLYLVWEAWWQESSIHGLHNAGCKRKSIIRRSAWMIIFLIGFYFTVSGVVQVVMDFYSHPVATTVSIFHQNRVISLA